MSAVSEDGKALRELKREDLGALLALYTHLHETDEALPERALVEAAWDEALDSPMCSYFGGYAGDRLVSSCAVTVIPNLTRGCRPYALIENVVTHADHRRQGWGKALLNHALEFAWSRRCYKAMLMTGRKDEGTLRFYADAGFDAKAKQAFVAKPPTC